MLRDALRLHSRMQMARKIKYWDGPRGGQKISDTVYRRFQGFIRQYNECGRCGRLPLLLLPLSPAAARRSGSCCGSCCSSSSARRAPARSLCGCDTSAAAAGP